MNPIELAKELGRMRERLQTIMLRAEAERDRRMFMDSSREIFAEFAATARAALTSAAE
jgi:hypothetical protein